METRGTWPRHPTPAQWRGPPPARHELRAMTPYPANEQQRERVREYFISGPHVDHHVAMELARVQTRDEYADRLLKSVWKEMTAQDKHALLTSMVITWRRKAGAFFEEYRAVEAIDDCFREASSSRMVRRT